MDQSWRPRPIQGTNICPTCSISHFPFCPPIPHPSFYHGPNFEPNRGPSTMARPVYGDPYCDPGHRNPNVPPPHSYGYSNCYSHVNDDRSSKRLRVNGAENDVSLSKTMSFGSDHGGANLGFGVGGMGRFSQERSGFDGNVEFRELGGSRMGQNTEVGSAVGMGRGGDYRKEEVEYRSEYGSGYQGQGRDHQIGQFGQVARPPTNVGSSGYGGFGQDSDGQRYGYRPPNYGSNVEYVQSNGVGVDYGNRSHGVMSEKYSNASPPLPTSMVQPGHMGYGYHSPHHVGGVRQPIDSRPPGPPPFDGYHSLSNQNVPAHHPFEGYQSHGNQSVPTHPPFEGYQSHGNQSGTHPPFEGYQSHGNQSGSTHAPFEGYQSLGNHNVPTPPPFEPPHMSKPSEYGNFGLRHVGHMQPPQGFEFQPPLPSSPPPPLPKEPPVHWSTEHKSSASPKKESPSLFPVQYRSSAAVHHSHAPIPDSHVRTNPQFDNFKTGHASHGTFQGDSQGMSTTFVHHSGGSQSRALKNNLADKPKTVDAVHLFKQPHRTSRPDHFVIILRGLPGSGKSYIAKMLRDLELEHGGNAPRIHSMDDYFMTEVEKAEENDGSKPLARGKKSVTKTVIEYCYEPEMEEAYRSSMLKAFKKTLEEGVYTFVIVDDRNLRVADFAQFWAIAKRSGYEAYVLEAPYKDPAGCTARNVHGFTQDEVEKMAAKWEEASSLYLQLEVKSLFHGDDLKESNIKEVDMDTENEDFDSSSSKWDEGQTEKTSVAGNLSADVSPKVERTSDAELVNNRLEEVKELGRSKWSDDLDDDSDERTVPLKGKANVLSGLIGTYGKEGKSVHWGDQDGRSGFSIGAFKKTKAASLIIGPGAGYNLKSNPLPEEENTKSGKSEKTKRHSMFKERLQAEHDSFRAVFDRRRHRVGVLTEETYAV
ncbi:hypothetical protein vseg_003074 [Gypsophila vaccaria]